MEAHGWSFPDNRLTFQVRQDIGGELCCWPVESKCLHSPSPFPLDLDLGLRTWTEP